MHHLVNRTAILSQHHRIRDKNAACMHITWHHVHRQAGGNCTDANFYFWTIFQLFFFIQMRPGPTHQLPNIFWIFGNFLTLQSPLGHSISYNHEKNKFQTLNAVFSVITIFGKKVNRSPEVNGQCPGYFYTTIMR